MMEEGAVSRSFPLQHIRVQGSNGSFLGLPLCLISNWKFEKAALLLSHDGLTVCTVQLSSQSSFTTY